ncbi:Sodium/potassium-transporting ATPase subunit beta-1-interacting protein [Amphibalanus amphitrite]|uniref:Sodium/potassium-transporting ATPase subunit beta-1-interacting protein n=1 Tax=Amphibalanus amphitrite TaxID=1232801 RepID=A0A6A4VZN4_AMPAM|nr:Sodium/potassium-transporting ATPase subunit beta-1-interacting protein [Amphibalanus amphitrite]
MRLGSKYVVWAVIWLGWNVFVLCFYLEVGQLQRSNELLSLYTGAAPFWEASGPGCVPVYATNGTVPEDPFRPPRPIRVDGCWLPVEHVEALHAGIHLALAVAGLVLALCLVVARRREDDSSASKPRPLSPAFHIEYRPHRVEERPESPAAVLPSGDQAAGAVGAAPMTPRKIKRRAMSRSSQRSSGRSTRSGRSRSSQRQRRHANPVTQLLDSSSSELAERGHTNAGYLSGEPPRPPSVHSSYSNYHGQRRAGPPHAHAAAAAAAVASDYGTTGTLSAGPSGYGRRPAAASRYGSEYSDYGRAGPPPYEAVPSLTETSM